MMFLFENYYKIELSTPSLSTFAFIGTPFHNKLLPCGSHLCSIKHVYIDADMCVNYEMDSTVILSWLMELTDIESLAISSTTLQV